MNQVEQLLIDGERSAAISLLANRIFDSFDPDDFRDFWCQIQNGSIPYPPLHTLSDQQLVEIAQDTF
jgi:hypothetical protein